MREAVKEAGKVLQRIAFDHLCNGFSASITASSVK